LRLRIRNAFLSPRLLRLEISLAVATRHLRKTYLVSTDVEVEGSYLPSGSRSTSSSALNMVKHGMMTATTTSGTNGTRTLSTSLIGEDAGEVGRHVDDESDGGKFR